MSGLVVVLGIISGTSIIYWLVALRDLMRWLQRHPPHSELSDELAPVTFLRPIKPGVPALREKLEMLLSAAHPGDQTVFGVNESSAEAELCDELRRNRPTGAIAVVHCRAGAALNPKVSKLLQMTPLARHSSWILSDSEALLDRNFADALRWEWRAFGGDVLTCPYRFTDAVNWPQRLDAAATLLGLWPGLAVVRARGSIRFTLGACTAMRREIVEAVGGWARFADDLAEDQRLGEALAESGQQIRLSQNVVTLESDPLTWRDYWHHQRRVGVTYCVANRAGFAGMLLVQGVPASLLLGGLSGRTSHGASWLACALVLATRWWTARATARRIGAALPDPLSVVIASLVETVCWFGAWIVPQVSWAGRVWRVSARGKLRPKR